MQNNDALWNPEQADGQGMQQADGAIGEQPAQEQTAEQPQYQEYQYQEPQYQEPQYQVPQYQEPQYQAPQYQQPQYQAPQYQPQYQAPQYQQPQYQAPQYQPQYQQPQYQPQYQAPQYQQPQYRAPQYQQPQYRAPQYQQPQYQAPQYQQPQYQAPQYQPKYQPPMLKPQKAPAGLAWLPIVLALAAVVLEIVLANMFTSVFVRWRPEYLRGIVFSLGTVVKVVTGLIVPVLTIVAVKQKSGTVSKIMIVVSALALVVQLVFAVVEYPHITRDLMIMRVMRPYNRFSSWIGGSGLLAWLTFLADSLAYIGRRGLSANIPTIIMPLCQLLFFAKNILCIVFNAKKAKTK